MSERIALNREPRILVFGILLIALGVVLLLDRLDLLFIHWKSVAWVVGACLGLFFVVDGFVRKGGGRIYWGSVLFFFCLYWVLAGWDVVFHHNFYVTPVILLSFGLSFLVLFASRPREIGLLLPGILLAGTGALMILWWWEYIEWYEVRYALRTYWPVILVIWGVTLLMKRRNPPIADETQPPAKPTAGGSAPH